MAHLQELVLELTDCCPLQCVHCSSHSGAVCSSRLPFQTPVRLVREAGQLGATKVSLGGGEPMCSPDLLAVIRTVADVGATPEIFTCGARGTPPVAIPDTMIRPLAAVPHLRVIFSIHGSTPHVHDSITEVPGSFRALTQSLDRFLQAGVQCELNFVPLRVNVAQFLEVVRFAEKRGVSRLSLLRFVPQGRGKRSREMLAPVAVLSPRAIGRHIELGGFRIKSG